MKSKDMIAVGSNIHGHVWPNHFGGSLYFLIYDVNGKLHEKRLNPYGPLGSTDEHQHHGPGRIVKLLPECSVFIGSHIGHADVLTEQFGIVSVVTMEQAPDMALQQYLARND